MMQVHEVCLEFGYSAKQDLSMLNIAMSDVYSIINTSCCLTDIEQHLTAQKFLESVV